MKKLIGVVAVTAIAGALLLPSAPASAAQAGAAVGVCHVTLPEWPTTSPRSAPDCAEGGSLPIAGTAVGAILPGGPICAPLCDFRASVPSYSEDCLLAEPPLTGFASGSLFLNNQEVATYEWTRVGLVAVILVDPTGDSTVDAGAGVAAFLPDPTGLGTCDNHLPLDADVVGAVFAAQAP